MVTQARVRAVRELEDKRARDRRGVYVVEGAKLVREALSLGLAAECVYAEKEWIRELPEALVRTADMVVETTPEELRRLSGQVTPHAALAVLRKPLFDLDWAALESDLVLVLEGVQDPGNLGSLLRVAAWFGIADVVTSPDSADAFGPKAVQAGMGALFHVRVHVLDVGRFLTESRARGLSIYAAALGGEPVYEAVFEPRGVLLLGNESSGLSEASLSLATRRLMIPAWNGTGPGRDSLNVAMAAAALCSEFRRRARPGDAGQAHHRP